MHIPICLVISLFSFFSASNRGKQQPYEKEKALCYTLMSYLEKLHTNVLHLSELQVSSPPDKELTLSPGASMLTHYWLCDSKTALRDHGPCRVCGVMTFIDSRCF